MKNNLLFALISLFLAACQPCKSTWEAPFGPQDLVNFQHPPRENRPETWFHFIGDNVSREGVEADLQAISEAGIGGIQWFHGAFGGRWPGVEHPVIPLSEEWEQMVGHMARTAHEKGLRLTLQTCPGWAMAGGPWIEPEEAMRDLVWSRTDVPGGQKITLQLPKGQPSEEDWRDYQDICVLAFPTPEGDTGAPLTPKGLDIGREDWSRTGAHTFRFSVAEDAPIRTLELPSVESLGRAWCNEPGVHVSLKALPADGGEKLLVDADLPMVSWQDIEPFCLAVNEVAPAREYELCIRNQHPITLGYVRFYSASRQNDWRGAAGRTLRSKELFQGHARRSAASYVRAQDILDLSAQMTPDGSLEWQVPDNRAWTILRYGHVNIGYKNSPAPAEATGWECNKLDRRGAQKQFSHYVGRLQNGPVAGLAGGMLMDSWECYNQNWTADMEAQFRTQNDYELRQWMPALSGYVLDNPETTARFLTDWRRTRSNLYIQEFFQPMVEQAHAVGMQVQYETAAADVVAMDPLEYYKYADVPMCEFWQPITENFVGSLNFKPVKPTASAAHIYGKKRVAAESFTSFELTWDEHWEMLKEVANLNLSEGVTHTVFHTYTHNPQVGFLPPGTSFGNRIGTPFLRGQTWWPYMPYFTTYLARLSYLLERGKPVVDVLWYLGDEVGNKPDQLAPFPAGFKYDYCNPDVLLNRLEVMGGELCIPEGQRYRVLWIPENERMLPQTVEKLCALIRAGAKVVAGPPQSPATLQADAEAVFQKAVESIWTRRGEIVRLGKGCIAWDVPLEEALNSWGLQPQLKADGGEVLWYERETEGARWFFVAAPVGGEFHGTLDLLAEGEAECWDAVTGTVHGLESQTAGNYQRVRLDLERAQNVFVVFRKNGAIPPVPQAVLGAPRELQQWTLSFPAGWGAPDHLSTSHLLPWKDLPMSSAEGRAFSGTVLYETRFEWDGSSSCLLDLGRVDMIADVRVNGEQAGVLWATPYRLEIGPWVHPGSNTLQIYVTSTWYNRLAYDADLPEAQRKTWTIAGPEAGSPLRESGLLGPVQLFSFQAQPQAANKADAVVAALQDPKSKYVVVVSHRGDWRNYPENSLPAIESVIKMGVDMMELDLKMTRDSVLVLMHDGTLDRTTTGHGKVSDYSYEELLAFDLKRGHGIAIPGLKVPTLRQALELCKDRITVNVDQGYEFYDKVLAIAEELGVTHQILIKGGYPWPEVQKKLAQHPHNLMYMPVVGNVQDGESEQFKNYLSAQQPQMAYELCFNELNDNVRAAARKVLESGSKVWVNTIWGSLCGEHDDDKAFDAEDPDTIYAPILELGTSIIQTDRPQFLIGYLKEKGRR